MQLGVLPPYRTGVTADPAWMSTFARHAEDAGFESLYVVEHSVVIAGYDERYPYSADGRMPLPDDVDIPDPIELLAFLAAHTRRLRLATGIVVLPEHHPVVLAKRLATLDQLSGGRVTLGVGVGWMREELEAVGVAFSTRGRRTDEAIDALRTLWRHDEATFAGEHFRFERAKSHPKPVQAGGVPIHVGGHSEAAARRAGRRGDGYHPIGLDDAAVADRMRLVRAAAEAAGRDPAAIELTVGGPLATIDGAAVDRARDLGATRLLLSGRSDDLDRLRTELDRAVSLCDRRG